MNLIVCLIEARNKGSLRNIMIRLQRMKIRDRGESTRIERAFGLSVIMRGQHDTAWYRKGKGNEFYRA